MRFDDCKIGHSCESGSSLKQSESSCLDSSARHLSELGCPSDFYEITAENRQLVGVELRRTKPPCRGFVPVLRLLLLSIETTREWSLQTMIGAIHVSCSTELVLTCCGVEGGRGLKIQISEVQIPGLVTAVRKQR